MKYCYLDFEYNQTTHPKLNLVSLSITWSYDKKNFNREEFWLHKNKKSQDKARGLIHNLYVEGFIFISYAVTAEARAFISLDLDPTIFKWIDLFIEHRCLTNHNWKLQYGKQLIDGKPKNTFPPKPKWERKEGEATSQEAIQSLATACFKFLDVIIDSKEKDEVRDLILSEPEEFTEEQKNRILRYNRSDIKHLPNLFNRMVSEYRKLLPPKELKTLKKEMLWRGEFAARTAVMEAVGYPIDIGKTKSFSSSVPLILREIQQDINSQFDFKPFKFDILSEKFKWRQKETRLHLKKIYPDLISDWMVTKTKELSLSLDGFAKFFSYRHDYPRNNFGAQMVRYLKTKQSLNGFLPPKKGGTSFWNYVGPDFRVRPYFNIYRAQSSRSQPAATGFIFLKAAWMRALVSPSPGRAICGVDWVSQEFLIAALRSEDKNMLKAYESGDVYLWFGKATGRIPQEGTKKEYKALRDRFKSSVLGIQYLMGAPSLAKKITNDTGEYCSEHEAAEFIDLFNETFSDFYMWREDQIREYEIKKYLKLADGWYMFGDNQNFRSVANCPVQGTGGAIMRKSVQLAQDRGLDVIKTLHDALYIEFDSNDLSKVDELCECMDEGFRFYFPEHLQRFALCRLEPNIWSPDYPSEDIEITTPSGRICKKQQIYVDERSLSEYKRFQNYFSTLEDISEL